MGHACLNEGRTLGLRLSGKVWPNFSFSPYCFVSNDASSAFLSIFFTFRKILKCHKHSTAPGQKDTENGAFLVLNFFFVVVVLPPTLFVHCYFQQIDFTFPQTPPPHSSCFKRAADNIFRLSVHSSSSCWCRGCSSYQWVCFSRNSVE